jgi:Flp pilus assembly CpaF family ATPase/MinD-like ATPase involved in chromosome partitioning or flagellar assembly
VKKIITFVNDRNGSGKTTLAGNLAAAMSDVCGLKTGLLEISTGVFDTRYTLLVNKDYALSDSAGVESHFLEKEGFYLFWDRTWETTIRRFYEDIDILFIDTEGIQPQALYEISDTILIPAALKQTDIMHANHTARSIIDAHFPASLINIIVNKADSGFLSTADMQQVFGGIKVAGVLPFDRTVEAASQKGELFYIKNKKEVFSKGIRAAADILNSGGSKPHLQILGTASGVFQAPADSRIFNVNDAIEKSEEDKYGFLKKAAHKKLLAEMDVRNLEKDALTHPEKKAKIHIEIKDNIRVILDSFENAPADRDTREVLVSEIFDEVAGLGAIEPYLKDPAVSEIMVNRHDLIYYEKKGKLHRSTRQFTDDENVMRAIERIVMPLGRRIDESMPYVDARLPDGSRVHAIIPPLAIDGPVLTIRKFSNKKLTGMDLVEFKSATVEAMDYLRDAVVNRKNILISGGTGSGKTTLLNIMSSYIPEDERIITVEDSAELKLAQEHVIRLEARPSNIEGKGAVPIRELVKNCLRMRPDRIVVGECRGGEALDMLQAMNTGHDGSMTTVHANTPRDALSRIEIMVLMAGVELPLRAIREQIKSAIEIVVQQARLKDGSRKITHISEVTGMENDKILMHDVFLYRQDGPHEPSLIRVDRI